MKAGKPMRRRKVQKSQVMTDRTLEAWLEESGINVQVFPNPNCSCYEHAGCGVQKVSRSAADERAADNAQRYRSLSSKKR